MREKARRTVIKRNTTHGLSHSRTYRIWCKVKERCENPKCKSFADYGGRGITIWKEWSDNFDLFYSDMGGPCPAGLEIDRIDNDGNYEPGNCRWATRKEQANNKRSNRLIQFQGTTRTLAEWSEITGVDYKTLHTRLSNGWSVDKTLGKAARPRRKPGVPVYIAGE
jgi:hypothetical protein